MNHFISREKALRMVSLYRKERENILKPDFQGKDLLVYSETFDRQAFDTILGKPGCEKLRIYYGVSDDLAEHAIIVAVSKDGRDILMDNPPQPQPSEAGEGEGEEDDIIEEGARCPPLCPET